MLLPELLIPDIDEEEVPEDDVEDPLVEPIPAIPPEVDDELLLLVTGVGESTG